MKLYNNRNLAEEEVDKIIKECDQNLSGNIDFTGLSLDLIDIFIKKKLIMISKNLLWLLSIKKKYYLKQELNKHLKCSTKYLILYLIKKKKIKGWQWIYFEK